MQIREYLKSICEQIKYKPIREEISNEIEVHIIDLKQEYISDGIKEEDAEQKAIEQMGNAEEIGKKLNQIHRPRLDFKLIFIIIILLGFGFLVSFIRASQLVTNGNEANSMTKYIFFLIIGVVLSVPIYFIDYRKILKYSNILYGIASGIILWTLLFGVNVNGIPHIYISTTLSSISPYTIAVPLYIISFVGFINNLKQENKIKILQKYHINIKLVKVIVLSLISLYLLFLIPSVTSVFILGLTYLIIGTVKIIKSKENKTKNILMLWGIPLIIGLILVLYLLGGVPYIADRFEVTFNPESDASGMGWLGVNRKIIINSAQLYGEADDMSTAIDLFDEGTIFAFISILAHYGWIVAILVTVSILLLSIKLIINAIKIKENYGKSLIIGISSMFILQSIFNILMNLNLWMESNYNLPFVSYGGVNLIINLMCLSLILSVYRKKDLIFESKELREKVSF